MGELLDRAKQAAEEAPDNDWGYRLDLDPGAGWEGRWRGEDVRRGGDFGDQRVFLMWDREGFRCHIYARSRLARSVDAVAPVEGDSVAIFRGPDEFSNGRTIYAYGIAAEPNDDPLPVEPEGEPVPVQTSMAEFGEEAPW